MIDDAELLRRYAASRAEADFAELVRRHVNLVYSCALRQVNGDAHLAQDVTQTVFTDLARKAGAVASHRVLVGWLFTSARFAAAKAVRGEQRRHVREREATFMQEVSSPDDSAARLDWDRVRPVLDEVLAELSEHDREAILLRYFEGRDYASVGVRLNITDNAARMRVERALDKLHGLLASRGVTSTSAALATALANQAVVAAPAGLAAAVTGAALAGAGTGAGAWLGFMSMTKLQIGISGALLAAAAVGLVRQTQANAELRNEIDVLRRENAAVATLRTENNQLKRTAAEVADMRNDDAELKRLNDEVVALKTKMQQAERTRAAARAAGDVFEISKLDQTPRPTFQARPQYPFELRQAGIGGQVVVDFVVDANGEVQAARALRSSLAASPEEVAKAIVKLTPFTVAAAGQEFTGGSTMSEEDVAKLLEASAVEAVGKWKFKAGRKGGRDVNTHLQVPIVFTVAPGPGAPKAGK